MYNYQIEKAYVFTERGQVDFLKVRDHVKDTLKKAGAIRMQEAIKPVMGDSWQMLALVDRLVELGEIIEIENTYSSAGQHRIFIEP